MKKRISTAFIAALCMGLFLSFQVQAASAKEKITVLTPLGHPPNIKLKKMAPRLDTLDGKTIYFVDDGFIGGDNLLNEMVDWFKANYPGTNVLYKRKGGMGFEAEDPQLWAEMKEKSDAIVIGLGH
ncbi:MAG: hypothetical protein PVG39_15225 [Desulfobacteraceae bacterium]|jgi:hypothetical protein